MCEVGGRWGEGEREREGETGSVLKKKQERVGVCGHDTMPNGYRVARPETKRSLQCGCGEQKGSMDQGEGRCENEQESDRSRPRMGE